jgi:hypothetical protein
MPHFPVTPAPEFDGKTGNGYWADALAQMDSYSLAEFVLVAKWRA